MNILRFFTNRLTIIALLIVVQLVAFLGLTYWLAEITPIVYFGCILFSLLVAVYVMSNDDNPSYKILWTVVIMAIPLLGGICYFLFGNKRLPKKVKTAAAAFNNGNLSAQVRDPGILDELKDEDMDLVRIAKYLDTSAGFPLWSNTEARYFSLGEHKYFAMLEELEKAKSYILLEYFIIHEGQMWNNIHEILRRKATEGVDVYIMYDDMGCINTLPFKYEEQLRNEGFHVNVFNPFRPHLSPVLNYRDHRKILVVDGKVGFCGGINLADEYINKIERFGHWKDTAVMIKGDAVWNLVDTFFRLWNFACTKQEDKVDSIDYRHTISKGAPDGYVQPFSDSPLDFENVSENFFLNVINKATDYVYITTPYLVIDHEMSTALCLAAKNGVDVRLITPGIPDKKTVYEVTRSFYPSLIEAGVRIYEYTPGFIHAKNVVSDDKIALVGTINLDYRSFYFHFECGVAFYDSSVIPRIKKDVEDTMSISQEYTLAMAKSVSLPRYLFRAFLRLFAPLL